VQAQIIWQAIADRNERLKVLQERWDYLRDALTTLIEERAAELEGKAAGGSTGLIAKDAGHRCDPSQASVSSPLDDAGCNSSLTTGFSPQSLSSLSLDMM
jgi:hypothetical protein